MARTRGSTPTPTPTPAPALALAVLLALVGALAATPGEEDSPPPPRLMPLAGAPSSTLVRPEETLLDIAWRERVSYETLARLNPGVDPWIPEPGTLVRLPTRTIYPDVERRGLLINIPEMRLFVFDEDGGESGRYPVAVGDPEDPTPVGRFRIGRKRTDPAWHVPESIRAEKPELPAVVPPGPDNPLGSRWMTIGESSYGIHGTSIRWSVGHMATHGCVRLYEPDIQELYDRVPKGTTLQIVYQPFKWGRHRGRIYVEVHPDIYGRAPDRLAAALAVPRALDLLMSIDLETVWRAVEEARGVPVEVGRLPANPTWRSPS